MKSRRPNPSSAIFIDVPEAVRRIGAGQMIIVVDDADRENEGDVVFAAEKATAEKVNFAVKHGRGILCAPMAPQIADRRAPAGCGRGRTPRCRWRCPCARPPTR